MKNTYIALAAASVLMISGVSTASASDETRHMSGHHMHGAMHGDAHNPCSMPMDANKGMKEGTFLQSIDIDGYNVSFHVMKAPEGMAHGGSYHYMIKVEKADAVIPLQAVNSKVTHPDNTSESKMMMKMGDWYMAGYDLEHPGAHKLMVLFKTEDGKKHFGGLEYTPTK
jgi:hypothetical protein